MPASFAHSYRIALRCCLLLLLQAPILSSCATTPTPNASVAGEDSGYLSHPDAEQFITTMVNQHHLPRAEVTALLAQAKKQQSILDAIARPAEGKPWRDYQPIFVNASRINGGVDFWNTNAAILNDTRTTFSVDPQVIVAIIGVETRYGGNTGSYRVLDALSTLGFDFPKRGEFFRGELEQFMLLVREENVDALTATGSYAGAMGQGQFIPSSYRQYAVDFDGDGKRDLWHSERDVLGSVANYLKVHGWQLGAPVVTRAQVSGTAYRELLDKGTQPHMPASELSKYGVQITPPADPNTQVALLELDGADGLEQWVVFNNFYVITRYNRSPLYAMSVYQLSEAIKAKR